MQRRAAKKASGAALELENEGAAVVRVHFVMSEGEGQGGVQPRARLFLLHCLLTYFRFPTRTHSHAHMFASTIASNSGVVHRKKHKVVSAVFCFCGCIDEQHAGLGPGSCVLSVLFVHALALRMLIPLFSRSGSDGAENRMSGKAGW